MYSIMFLLLLATGTYSQTNVYVAPFKGDKAAAISYTFDDGLLEQYTELFPMLKKYNIQASFCVNGNTINRYEKMLKTGVVEDSMLLERPRTSWKMLKEMNDQGQEITSHGWAHQNVTKIDGEALRYEVQHNDTVIWQHTGKFPRTFFYPGNRMSPERIAYCEQDRVGTRTRQVSIGSKRDEAWLKAWIASLITNHQWGIGMTHGISRGYDHFPNPQVLWNHFAYVNGKRDSLWIATFHDVAAYQKEYENIKLSVKESKHKITVSPNITLNKELFHEPLTLVIDTPVLSAHQAKKALKIEKRSDGKSLVEFDPHHGMIILKK